MDWSYQGRSVTEDDLDGMFGFVYLITNTKTGRKYVGRKYLTRRNRKKVKGKTRRKIVISESDWKDYWGSCKELTEEIGSLGEDTFSREILSLHRTRRDVNYHEAKQQFDRAVLDSKLPDGTPEYYNGNIMLRFYRPR